MPEPEDFFSPDNIELEGEEYAPAFRLQLYFPENHKKEDLPPSLAKVSMKCTCEACQGRLLWFLENFKIAIENGTYEFDISAETLN